MINLRKIKFDTILLIVMLALMAGYHFFVYFRSPWIRYGESIRQIRHDSLIVIGCSFFAFFALFILSILLLLTKKYPNKITLPIVIMLIFGIFWIGYSILFDDISPTLLLRDSFPPMSMITCGLIMVGYNHKWWGLLKKAIFLISCVFVLYAFAEIILAFIKFGFNYRITSGAPMYLYIIGLYATYGLVTLTSDWLKNKKIIVFILCILLFFNSAILQGRSWFIQTIVLFIIYLKILFVPASAPQIISPVLFMAFIPFISSGAFIYSNVALSFFTFKICMLFNMLQILHLLALFQYNKSLFYCFKSHLQFF